MKMWKIIDFYFSNSQKLTLAFIQEEEDLKLAVALFQEDQDRKLAVALTQEEQDRLLALKSVNSNFTLAVR